MQSDLTSFVEAYTSVRPLAFSWWRLLEFQAYQSTPISSPVLDLGTGDGLFGSFLYRESVAFGVDREADELKRVKPGVYRGVACSNAEALPFAAGSFSTVLANCVLEHVAGLSAALSEARRVLRGGGHLVATVPAACFGQRLLGARLTPSAVSAGYSDLVNRLLDHKNLLDDAGWRDRLAAAGFRAVEVRPLVSPAQLWLFETGMFAAVPAFVSRRLTSHWRVLPKPGAATLLRTLLKRAAPATLANCAAYLIVATA